MVPVRGAVASRYDSGFANAVAPELATATEEQRDGVRPR
jgi:hypothetical protein